METNVIYLVTIREWKWLCVVIRYGGRRVFTAKWYLPASTLSLQRL